MKQLQPHKRDFVRPLREAENQFLQVLLTKFLLKSRGRSFDLEVAFNSESPAIWLRDAKRYLMQILPPERRESLQAEIENFFESGQGGYEHDDSSFPFRLGNGGTLPVVSIEGNDYYCLFFRDTHPTGWNIANGGANNLSDLLHPDAIIERELREELIIVEPAVEKGRGRRYVFDWHDAHLRDHPDFALANHLWMDRFREQNWGEFAEVPLPLKWLPSADAQQTEREIHSFDSIWISFDDELPVRTGNGFLNINAEDFGIEFDRIAKLAVGPEAVFCDGELVERRLLNRVLGLFEVGKVHANIGTPEAEFWPDRLFWDGREHLASDLQKIIESYLRNLPLSDLARPGFRQSCDSTPLRLCPVTRSIIRRYMRTLDGRGLLEKAKFDVFLSFGSEDCQLARQVYDSLNVPGQRQVFFSDASLDHGPFARQIDRALDDSWAFVAIASQPRYLYKSWVQYEWESFHNDILSGRKHRDTPFLAFTVSVDPNDLPRPFRRRNVICSKPDALGNDLHRLSTLIRKP